MPVVLRHYYPTLKVTVEPTLEPVTVPEGLAYAGYEGADDASFVKMEGVLLAARQKVERDAGVALITQTQAFVMDQFPCGEQAIRLAPIQSISASYVDADGVTQSLTGSAFDLDTTNLPPRFGPAYDTVWPSTRCVRNAVTFSVVAGYGSDAGAVPEAAKLAIKMLAKSQFYGSCEAEPAGYWDWIRQFSWKAGV